MKKKRYFVICLLTAIFFFLSFQNAKDEYKEITIERAQQQVALLDVHPDPKCVIQLREHQGLESVSLVYQFQAKTEDEKVNFLVLGSESFDELRNQKEDQENTILLPEKIQKEIEVSEGSFCRFVFESTTGRAQTYQFARCEWINGDYAMISQQMAEKIIRELDTESRQPDGIYFIANSTEGLKNIEKVIRSFSKENHIDIESLIRFSEHKDKKMRKLTFHIVFEILFLQMVIYLISKSMGKEVYGKESSEEKNFFRTETIVLFMLVVITMTIMLKII